MSDINLLSNPVAAIVAPSGETATCMWCMSRTGSHTFDVTNKITHAQWSMVYFTTRTLFTSPFKAHEAPKSNKPLTIVTYEWHIDNGYLIYIQLAYPCVLGRIDWTLQSPWGTQVGRYHHPASIHLNYGIDTWSHAWWDGYMSGNVWTSGVNWHHAWEGDSVLGAARDGAGRAGRGVMYAPWKTLCTHS